VSITGGEGVVIFIGSVPVLPTVLVAVIVKAVEARYVACAIVKRPFESIVTPDVVGEYDHVTVPTSGVLCVNWIVLRPSETSSTCGEETDDVTVGTAGVVSVTERSSYTPTGLVARTVNAFAGKNVPWMIVSTPVPELMETPVVGVPVSDHASVPVSDAVFVNDSVCAPVEVSIVCGDVGDPVLITGGAGVVTVNDFEDVEPTELVAVTVNDDAVKYVYRSIVKRPVVRLIDTPDVVGEYVHVTGVASVADWVAVIDVYAADDTSTVRVAGVTSLTDGMRGANALNVVLVEFPIGFVAVMTNVVVDGWMTPVG
jgi:hypothetical protein